MLIVMTTAHAKRVPKADCRPAQWQEDMGRHRKTLNVRAAPLKQAFMLPDFADLLQFPEMKHLYSLPCQSSTRKGQ